MKICETCEYRNGDVDNYCGRHLSDKLIKTRKDCRRYAEQLDNVRNCNITSDQIRTLQIWGNTNVRAYLEEWFPEELGATRMESEQGENPNK